MQFLIQSMREPQKFVVFDAIIEEKHNYRSDVANYAVESGYDISDHIRALPLEFSLVGFVSESPTAENGIDGIVNTTDALETILELSGHSLGDAHPLRVVSSQGEYKDMYITDNTNPGRIGGIEFSLSFKRIRKVETILTKNLKLQNIKNRNNVDKVAASQVSLGKQATSPVTGTDASLISKIINKVVPL